MAIDTSMYRYQPQEQPSMLDTAGKAMTLKQLAMQTQKAQEEHEAEKAFKGAFSKHVGPDGTVNSKGVVSELVKVGQPMKAIEAQGKLFEMDAKTAEMKSKALEQGINQMGLIATLAMSAKDQAGYDQALQQASQMGLPIDKMPKQFDPGYMRRIAFMSLDQQKRLAGEKQLFDEAAKRRELGQKDRELGQKDVELGVKKRESQYKTADELRKERSNSPVTKDTQQVAVAYNKIQQAAKDATGASDMSMIFAYMKMLDPGSTVREGEYATAQNTTGVPQRIMNLYNRAKDGTFLDPAQRADFVKQAGRVWTAQKSQQEKIDRDFGRMSDERGVNRKDVLLNFNADSPYSDQINRVKQMAGQQQPGTTPGTPYSTGENTHYAGHEKQWVPPVQPPGTVRMIDTEGTPRNVPQNKVNEFIANGGRKAKSGE